MIKKKLVFFLLFCVIPPPAVWAAGPIVQGDSSCTEETFNLKSGRVKVNAIWNPIRIDCDPGTYLAKDAISCSLCLENHFCNGGTFAYNAEQDNGISECEGELSPTGATSNADCGKKLHVGNDYIYVYKEKRTSPAMAIDLNGTTYYAMLTTERKQMNKDTTHKMHVEYNGSSYYAYDKTVQ